MGNSSASRVAASTADAFASLPAGSVIRDAAQIARYQNNVSALSRNIPLVLRPSSAAEIPAIVAEANQRLIPLYPISTGNNWGMGSKLPATDGCAVLDLSRLNRIIEVNEAQCYAVVEPGVTQAQLAKHLAEHHPALSFNLTGTFGETSIIGNTIERGDGSYARIDDMIGVRGILGNGQPFEAGGHFGMGGADTCHVMRYVAGPDLVGLFSQSNFGVVTQMVFRLQPRAEKRNLFWGTVEDAKLPELFDRLQWLIAQRIVVPAMINVGYANRFEQARSTLGDKSADTRFDGELWNFYIVFDGSLKLSKTILEELRGQLMPCCLENGHYESGADPAVLPPHLKPLARPITGTPDADSIKLIYKLTGVEPPADPKMLDVDQTPFGMKSYVGVVPPVAAHVRKVSNIAASVRAQFKVNIKPSFFGDGRFLNTILFLRTDPKQVAAAEQAHAAMWEQSVPSAGVRSRRMGWCFWGADGLR